MVADPQHRRISVEDYFTLDQASEIRYEYIDGYAYAMSGGTVEHSWLAMNVARLLDELLKSGSCRVFNSDLRVQLSEKRYVLPDVTVSCDAADSKRGNDSIRSPRLVVEVLSPSTESYDRGRKFIYYQECSTIQEYMLVSSQYQMIEVYRRKGQVWTYQRYRPEQSVGLECLDIQLSLVAIYDRVDVPIEEEDDLL